MSCCRMRVSLWYGVAPRLQTVTRLSLVCGLGGVPRELAVGRASLGAAAFCVCRQIRHQV